MPKVTFTSTGGSIVCNMGEGQAPYTLSNMQGLAPSNATINMTQMATSDGALFNSSKVNANTLLCAIAIE